MEKITILIADDHTLVRETWSFILNNDPRFQVVAECGSGEEAVELVIEAKDNNRDLFLNEAADLMYHFLVLLAAKDCTLHNVNQILEARHNEN